MFTQLLGQHFVHTALWAGAVVALVSGAIGVFVVARGMSFAVHAISELGFTGAAGALVIGIDPVLGMIGGSLLAAALFVGVLAWLAVPNLFGTTDYPGRPVTGADNKTASTTVGTGGLGTRLKKRSSCSRSYSGWVMAKSAPAS